MRRVSHVFVLVLIFVGCSRNSPVPQLEEARSTFSAYVVDFWVHRDTTVITRVLSPSLVYHYNGRIVPGEPASHYRALREFGSSFPDLAANVDVFTFDGAFGAAVTSWTGTHLGKLMGIPLTGMRDIAPTGKQMSWSVNYIFRIEAGRIAELWEVWDEGSVYTELMNATVKSTP